MGLGLAIVKQLCDLLGVEYQVDSKTGGGCKVQLSLDRGVFPKNAQFELSNIKSAPHNKCVGNKIIIVDDDPNVLMSMSTLLQSWRYDVLACADATEALEALQHYQAELIISDYRLNKGMDGLALIAEIRKRGKADFPAILVTADTLVDIEVAMKKHFDALGLQNTQYVHKPIQAAKLRLMLNHFIQ